MSGVLKRLGFGIDGVVPGGPDEALSPLGEAISVAGVDTLVTEVDWAVACGVAGVTVGSEIGGPGAIRFIFEVSIAVVGGTDGMGAPIATGGGLRMAVGTGAADGGRSLYATEPAAKTCASSHFTPICPSYMSLMIMRQESWLSQ